MMIDKTEKYDVDYFYDERSKKRFYNLKDVSHNFFEILEGNIFLYFDIHCHEEMKKVGKEWFISLIGIRTMIIKTKQLYYSDVFLFVRQEHEFQYLPQLSKADGTKYRARMQLAGCTLPVIGLQYANF